MNPLTPAAVRCGRRDGAPAAAPGAAPARVRSTACHPEWYPRVRAHRDNDRGEPHGRAIREVIIVEATVVGDALSREPGPRGCGAVNAPVLIDRMLRPVPPPINRPWHALTGARPGRPCRRYAAESCRNAPTESTGQPRSLAARSRTTRGSRNLRGRWRSERQSRCGRCIILNEFNQSLL